MRPASLGSFKKSIECAKLEGVNPYLTETYSFELPSDLIASEPLQTRDASRLLIVKKKSRTLEHASIQNLPELLDSSYTVVANNTQVFKARLLGERAETGGKIEFFLLKKVGPARWQGLMKSNSKIRLGLSLVFKRPSGESVNAEIIDRIETAEGAIITAQFSADPIEADLGEVPLPPYILSKRENLSPSELESYNTVFAKQLGSVAAPTAGRHFTLPLIQKLKEKGIGWDEITLHVGLGTFKPVGARDVREHTMHAETTDITETVAQHLNQAKQADKKILAIGTTTTRTLEARATPSAQGFYLEPGIKDVNLFIHPGSNYQFKFVDAILTNFHLPESTLFMMLATFVGDTAFLHEVYRTAIEQKYRFYSYGDAMLVLDA